MTLSLSWDLARAYYTHYSKRMVVVVMDTYPIWAVLLDLWNFSLADLNRKRIGVDARKKVLSQQ